MDRPGGSGTDGSLNPLPPNKRLKLAGGDRFKGTGALCPGGHGLSSPILAQAGESPAGYSLVGAASRIERTLRATRPLAQGWGTTVRAHKGTTLRLPGSDHRPPPSSARAARRA